MEEFLYKALSESEEVYDEEFDTSIEHETYNETLTFDHHSLKSLKNLQEIMTQSINKLDDELFERECYLRQLSGTWEIDSQAVKEVKRDISALRICLYYLNFDQRTVHEFESKNEQSTDEKDESKKISILKELVKLFNNITTDKSKMENYNEEHDQEQLLKNVTSHSL
ncbi:hypothetical protein C2G38_2209308 [Gigaspora rosea]|uniref:Uncharacterized protein n=1 Tax=Gigaspora rosea TaxID=44941 RepID=A0A397UG88_9GLOM|nr:hypothetical protein C2G38_2209308 [Gigaspora rosea]